jgi:hypothetical protein
MLLCQPCAGMMPVRIYSFNARGEQGGFTPNLWLQGIAASERLLPNLNGLVLAACGARERWT